MTFEPPVTATLHHTLLSVTHYNADIDECNDNYTCSYMEGTVCYNTYGSYDCLCLPGYTQCYENSQCTCELFRYHAAICIHTRFPTHTNMHTHTHTHIHTHKHTHTHTQTHTHTHTQTHTHTHTHTNTHTHTHTQTHTHTHKHTDTHTQTHTRRHTHMHTHACTHTQIHTNSEVT